MRNWERQDERGRLTLATLEVRGRSGQIELCEFEANLFYLVRSRLAGDTCLKQIKYKVERVRLPCITGPISDNKVYLPAARFTEDV